MKASLEKAMERRDGIRQKKESRSVANVECNAKLKKYTIHLSTKSKKEEVQNMDFDGKDACVITKMGFLEKKPGKISHYSSLIPAALILFIGIGYASSSSMDAKVGPWTGAQKPPV